MPRFKVGDYMKKIKKIKEDAVENNLTIQNLENEKKDTMEKIDEKKREIEDLNKKFNAKQIQFQRLDDKVSSYMN